jgi:cytochrome P450
MTEIVAPFPVDPQDIDPIDILSDHVRQNATEICTEWAYRKPFYVNVDGSVEVLCTRYDDVADVYRNPEIFSAEIPDIEGYVRFNKTMGVKQLAQMEGEPHNRLRKLMGPAFSPRSIKVLSDEITTIVDGMIDAIEAGPNEFDAMRMFADHLIVKTLLSAMFKLNDSQRQVMLRMAEVLADYSNLRRGEPVPEASTRAFEETSQVIRNLIAERQARPGADFISDLISARDEGDALSEQELFDQVFMVCIAALTTTPTTMGGILLTLSRHSEQLADLKANIELAGDAVDECQRIHSHRVVGAFARFATKDVELGGTKIFKHMPVHLSIQAGNLDPKQYPDPLVFDIHRKPRGLLAFGLGVHHCMGSRLAKLVLTIALTRFLQRLPDARLADPDFVPRYGGGAGGRRIAVLPMRIR